MTIYVIELITEDGDSLVLTDTLFENEEKALKKIDKLTKRNKDFYFGLRSLESVEEL